ncbi:uncharacterized protein IL334_000442 [Kwoniella shivajii]|uniref:GmrSD restriction endonucleases N-terminal domain-containing protein n=1 Tax=Kwoniella shivajii TaxID=564305 RepID=A0ABZ1CTE0_9TREE|nr:hypothetical protein IL334_000442 [Kwoniella shivajii]
MPPRDSTANYTTAGALSDDSDLDDLFDELEEDEELDGSQRRDKKPKRKGPVDSAELIKGSLVKPHNIAIAAKSLHGMIHQGDVELCPAYQRDVVWPEAKMIALIQSLFMNFYVPPVIFAVEREGTQEKRICIDGKQRCSSILNFMDGKIPFISPNTKEKFWYNKLDSHRSGKQLPRDLKSNFDLLQLAAVEYHGMTDSQQRDVFQRVQLGVALSAAEKLQAHSGPWPGWIIELDKRYIAAADTLGTNLRWDLRRGRSFQNLLGFVAMARESTPSKIWQPTATLLRHFVERNDAPDQEFKLRAQLALSIFINIAVNHFDAAFETTSTPRIAPVEFWFSSYLIYSRMGFLSIESIAREIGKMRAMIRVHVPGNVSTNTTVMGLLSHFIDGIPKKRKANEIPAAEQYEDDDDVDERDARAMKRSRRAEEQDPTFVEARTERTVASPPKTTTRAKAPTITTTNSTTAPSSSSSVQQSRPTPLNVSATSTSHRQIASLPTPSTANHQQPANGQQYQSSNVANNQQGVYQNGQYQSGGTSMSAEQMRQYTEARVKQQYPQQQQNQNNSNQYYGR